MASSTSSSCDQQVKSTNVVWHENHVTRGERAELNKHKSCAVWLTGLSGSGKSTVSIHLERLLTDRGCRAYVLDGDNIRHGLNGNLGFSPEDRTENIRRIGEVAKLFVDAGMIVIAAFISPYRADRDRVRSIMDDSGDFVEVHVDCSVEECEKRDVKGLYAKARAGEVSILMDTSVKLAVGGVCSYIHPYIRLISHIWYILISLTSLTAL